MVITPLFRKLEKPLIISQKLGLKISNVNENDRVYLLKQLVLELKQFNEGKKSSPPEYRDNRTLKDILFSKYYGNYFNKENPSSEIECLESICNNILMIYITDSNESMLPLKNQYSLNPTYEIPVERKVISLFSFLEDHKPFDTKRSDINIGYNDNTYGPNTDKTDIIKSMVWRVAPHILEENNLYRYTSHADECDYKIYSILAFGKLIDKYIISDQDFFVLDFIMDTLASNDSFGSTRFIRMTAMLEFLIAKSNYKSLRYEYRKKLPQFLSDSINDKDLWITMMYDIRNKIAHGDYFGLMGRTEKYAENFMKNFEYDYYEYNRMN